MRPPLGVKEILYLYKIPGRENYLLKPRDSELDKKRFGYIRTRIKNQYTADRLYLNGVRIVSQEMYDLLMDVN
ncbi:hypothetical protein EKK58_09965 [Candidatus Dependentiae bacterium]|nr:MAG: hypothetical protein EKK58_09965 [Candidatus Dependentiae bacterium]